jgi:hypothetical protein
MFWIISKWSMQKTTPEEEHSDRSNEIIKLASQNQTNSNRTSIYVLLYLRTFDLPTIF